MAKYKITAHLDFTEDVLELDDNLSEEEIENELYEYVESFFDWNYERIEQGGEIPSLLYFGTSIAILLIPAANTHDILYT